MSVRIRGNSFQVIYRCPGEASPRTETFKSKDEALTPLIRQIDFI